MRIFGAKWTKNKFFDDFEQKSKKLKFYFVYGVSIFKMAKNFDVGDLVATEPYAVGYIDSLLTPDPSNLEGYAIVIFGNGVELTVHLSDLTVCDDGTGWNYFANLSAKHEVEKKRKEAAKEQKAAAKREADVAEREANFACFLAKRTAKECAADALAATKQQEAAAERSAVLKSIVEEHSVAAKEHTRKVEEELAATKAELAAAKAELAATKAELAEAKERAAEAEKNFST